MTSHNVVFLLSYIATIAIAISAALAEGKAESSSSSSAAGGCPSWGNPGTTYPAIGRRTITLVDSNRDNRTWMVDIWYPAVNNGEDLTRYNALLPSEGVYVALDNPAVASPPTNTTTNHANGFPLLIFSHGYGGSRQQSPTLMEHLASWGFVIASPDHAGNSMNDPPGSDIPFTLRDRPLDVSFVIDTMLSEPHVEEFHLSNAVDRGVGVLGHSFGGLTSLLVAPNAGEWSDPRVKAIMPIAPAVGGDRAEYLPNIVVPTLVIGGLNDTVTPPNPNNLKVLERTNGMPRWNIVLSNTGHNSFADLCNIFDILVSVLGSTDTAYSFMGGGGFSGDVELGKQRLEQSFCETFESVQFVLGYYAVAFFNMMLMMGEDDVEERKAVIDCMAEQSEGFPLSTYDVVFDNTTSVHVEDHKEGEKEDNGNEVALDTTATNVPSIAPGSDIAGTKDQVNQLSGVFSIRMASIPVKMSVILSLSLILSGFII